MIPVLKINGEGEIADAGLAQELIRLIETRSCIPVDIDKDENYTNINNEYNEVLRMIKEKLSQDMMLRLEELIIALSVIEQRYVYLRGLSDAYLLSKLLEKGVTLTYRRFKEEENTSESDK